MKKFKITATIEGGTYKHFGIRPMSASLYGKSVDSIVEVEMMISDDQVLTDQNPKHNDYWGWFEEERKEFIFVWNCYMLLNMCFPYGIKAEEERKRGKAYRLEPISHKPYENKKGLT